ncbi:hypothetical protein ACFXPJ_34280, partial [Streptomyces goshikiensis]
MASSSQPRIVVVDRLASKSKMVPGYPRSAASVAMEEPEAAGLSGSPRVPAGTGSSYRCRARICARASSGCMPPWTRG